MMAQNNKITVFGASGHAKVVIATALSAGYEIEALVDADEQKVGSKILGIPIQSESDVSSNFHGKAIIAIGNNAIRKKVAHHYPLAAWVCLIHPKAVVHDSVSVGMGTVVFAGAVIQPDSVVGNHTIINTGASIDHDCQIGNFSHVAPGVNIAGLVEVGEGTFVGIGSSVIQQTKIGSWNMVGAGAAVTKSFGDHKLIAGVPAKIKKSLDV